MLAAGVSEPAPALDPSLWQAAPAGTAEPELVARDDDACPWSGPREVGRDGLRGVVVNGDHWSVGGSAGRHDFEQTLLACGYDQAARAFVKWRKARRKSQIVEKWGCRFPARYRNATSSWVLRSILRDENTPVQ